MIHTPWPWVIGGAVALVEEAVRRLRHRRAHRYDDDMIDFGPAQGDCGREGVER